MTNRLRTALTAAAILGAAMAAPAQHDAIPHRQDRPPNEPYSPAEAQSKMTVPEGFRVELVASEPDIVNPIAMTFDDRGRIFVTESIEYPRKPAGPGRDRVKILEDRDGDGRAEHVSVLADGLNIPTGVAVGYGGVWVLNAPDLLFLREKDGKEVSREVILTGFGRADTHELPSSLTWGPDGWLYGLNGVFNPSEIVDQHGKRHRFTCAMWRFHPRTRDFQVFAEGTSNPYGIAWDAEGSAIIEACHWANDHLFHFVETGIYNRQAGAYPPFAMKIGSITDHSHQKTAYCGIVNLDTDSFPPQYRERIVVGNIHGGCLNVDRLTRDGATYLAKAEPDLLAANDVWFMPVALKIGPDGSLYVLDWYDRYHCSQDAARDPAGVDRLKGRLWRLRYSDTPRAAKFDLATESDAQLVARLSSGNLYFRETAQRLLNERLSDRSTGNEQATDSLETALEKLLLDESAPRKTRLHALWSLSGGDALRPSFHEKLFHHRDATFRAWAVRVAGNQGKISPSLRENVVQLARDPAPDVQLQVAIAARKINDCDALAVLVDVLIHCGHDKVIPPIVWHNLHPLLESEGARFAALLHSAEGNIHRASPAVATLMHRGIDRLLSAQQPNVAAVVALLDHAFTRHNSRMPGAIGAVSAKLDALSDVKRAELREWIRPLLDRILADSDSSPLHLSTQLLAARLGLGTIDTTQVRTTLLAKDQSDDARLQALEALVAFRDRSLLEALPEVLSAASPEFATRVLAALGRVEDPRLADVILAEYPNLAPELQPLAIDLVMQREPWARKLLNAVLAEKMPKSVLNANHLRKILESNDREALWAVEKAFGRIREERNPQRERVVAEMTEYFREHVGDPAAGRLVFKSFCAQCHTIHGEGHKLGPDITANGRASFEQLVSNVFDPSLVIGPAYQVVTVVTEDGRNLTGLIAEDNDQRIVLRLPGDAEEIVPRNNINYLRSSKLSMMPEGIESVLTRQQLADVFAFLAFDKPPDDPSAKLIPGAPQLNPEP
ncbi:MAG: PVC-type heme-binding CxxCH protein [Pirellulales bacterium]